MSGDEAHVWNKLDPTAAEAYQGLRLLQDLSNISFSGFSAVFFRRTQPSQGER